MGEARELNQPEGKLVMDDADWRDLTAQLEANGNHDEIALVDVDPSVSREELWQRLRIVALAYQQKFLPNLKDYTKKKDLAASLDKAERQIERLLIENRSLRKRLDGILNRSDTSELERACWSDKDSERNIRIYQMRQDGMTLKAIADAVGLKTAERVRQIILRTKRRMEMNESRWRRVLLRNEHRSS